MDTITLNIGSILKDTKTSGEYRIINIQQNKAVLCQMYVGSLIIIDDNIGEIVNNIVTGHIVRVQERKTVVAKEDLTEKQRTDFALRKAMMHDMEKEYGPSFFGLLGRGPKPYVEQLIQKYGVARSTVWKYIRKYLQSGMDENALLDARRSNGGYRIYRNKRPGRHTKYERVTGLVLNDELRMRFNTALEMYKSGRVKTIQYAYDFLCAKYYTTNEYSNGDFVVCLLPESQRPTFRQFYYYCHKNLPMNARDIIKTSRQEQRNDKRLLLSDNLNGIQGPGDCFEMDEVEVDISLVSTIDPRKTVGRPIVYAMIDTFTRLIVAVSVSFDNNSVLAMTNCFLNLADDKIDYCKRYGLTISANIWPSGILPKRIRCDRGAEYRSNEAKRIFNELGITRELAPPAMGSLKGSVEQLFHQMHSAQNPYVEGIGLIEKRHDSKHHREAMLNIDDFTKVLLNFVVTHNQTFMEDYPLTREMSAMGIQAIPIKLWKYGINKYGTPRPIGNLPQYYYKLMRPVKATISRKGIYLDGLYYMNYNDANLRDKMYATQNKRVPIEMRMDERDVGMLYYLDEHNCLQKASLNSQKTGNVDYAGVTRVDYLNMREELQRRCYAGRETNIHLRVARAQMNSAVVDEARSVMQTLPAPDPTDMIESRHKEKQKVANRNRIGERLDSTSTHTSHEPTKEAEQAKELSEIDVHDVDFWKKAMELVE